jgi:hypothetical protein
VLNGFDKQFKIETAYQRIGFALDENGAEIESEVEDRLYGIRRDPLGFLEEMGYDFRGMIDFIDKDDLLESLINDSDYGSALNGYNGEYDQININGTDYIVMRTD